MQLLMLAACSSFRTHSQGEIAVMDYNNGAKRESFSRLHLVLLQCGAYGHVQESALPQHVRACWQGPCAGQAITQQ